MEFSIGDSVEVIDENLGGIVCAINDTKITFCCDDGFEYTYLANQLIRYDNEGNASHQTDSKFNFKTDDYAIGEIRPQFSISFKGKKPIFDLHLEELAPSHHFYLKHDALCFQLNFVREVIEKAKKSRRRRMVFIHGMGTGTLREALRKMLAEEHPNIEFFDGSYESFGQGATEIIIHGLGSLGCN